MGFNLDDYEPEVQIEILRRMTKSMAQDLRVHCKPDSPQKWYWTSKIWLNYFQKAVERGF
jgi:hypothetical protein